jgi:hypothetical protein
MKNLFFLLFAFPTFSYAQEENLRGCPKIFFTSNDILNNKCNDSLAFVGMRIITGGDVKIGYKNGEKKKINRKNVWGFRREGELPERAFKKYNYELVKIFPFPIYKRWRIFGNSYFFSNTLDNEVHKFTKKNIKKYLSETQITFLQNDKVFYKRLDKWHNPFHTLFSGIK